MAQTVKLKRSAVAGKAPAVEDLALGELALNTYDGKLYAKRDNGTASIVELSGGGGGGSTYSFSSTAPSSPSVGDEWTDADDGITYQWVNDGDTSQWVELGPSGIRGSLGPKAVTLVNPTNSENLLLFFTDSELKLAQIRSVVPGSSNPSVTFSVRYGSDISTSGTEVVTGGIVCSSAATGLGTTSFTNDTISANSFVWLTTSAVSGSVNALHVTITFV